MGALRWLIGVAVSLVCLAGLAPAAHAGWNNTDWDMSSAQVKALYPNAYEQVIDGQKFLALDEAVSFAGERWGGTPGAIKFGFDEQDKLVLVQLLGDANINVLKGNLAGQLGPPMVSDARGATFRDTKKSNLILASRVGGFITVLKYSKIAGEF